MKTFNFYRTIFEIEEQLNKIVYESGDLSDIGNEIGIVIAKHFDEENTVEDFINGLKHGISLTDGTHSNGDFNVTQCPSTKLEIEGSKKSEVDNKLTFLDSGHIGNVNDIAPNPKGKLHISPKKKIYIKKPKKGDSAGIGITSPDKNLEIINKKR